MMALLPPHNSLLLVPIMIPVTLCGNSDVITLLSHFIIYMQHLKFLEYPAFINGKDATNKVQNNATTALQWSTDNWHYPHFWYPINDLCHPVWAFRRNRPHNIAENALNYRQ